MRIIYLLIISVFMISLQLNAQGYCTDGGPDLQTDSNVESVDLIGENQSISYVGCQNGGNGVTGVEVLTSSQVADLVAGNTYTIDVQFGTCGGFFAGAGEVWIDFNQNLSFDASESIGTLANGTPPFPLSSFTFTVPSDAVNGTTRLRVMQEENGTLSLDPCADFLWGSVTDFGIDVSGGIDIDCQFPSNLGVNNITGTSADFSWDDVPDATAGYIYEIYNAGDIQGTDTPEFTGTFPAGNTSGTVSGLTPVTDYDFYLISDCGTDGTSIVNGPVPFTTLVTCPEPTNISIDNVNGISVDISFTESTNATNGHIWQLFASGDDPNSDTPIQTGNLTAGTSNLTITGLTPDTNYDFYLQADCGSDGLSEISFAVSFSTTVLCAVPSNFDAINIQATSADLGWTPISNDDNGYNWSVFLQGDDPVNDTPVASGNASSGNSSVNVTGLTENTSYEAYIETDCGTDGVSDLSAPLPFTTPCTAFTAPVTENFDGSSWMAGSGLGNNGDAIDNCWDRNPDGTNGNYFWGTGSGETASGGTGPNNDFSGNGKYVFAESSNGATGDEALLETPVIDASALTTPQVRFYYHMFGAAMGTLHVDVNDGSGYTNDVFSISGQQQTTIDADWVLVTVDLPNASVSNLRIRFRGEKGSGFTSDIAIDQFSLVEAPTCPDPDNITVSNITTTTADFSWNDETAATDGYNWFVFEAGDDPANDTPVASGSEPAGTSSTNVTGLPSSSALQFYVQSNCGNGDLSLLTPPLGFQTLCDVFPTPYFEDFANFNVSGDFVEDGCWEETSPGAFAWEVESGETTSNGTGPSGAEFGSNYLFTEASSGGQGDEAIVLSPDVDLSNLTDPSLSFWYHMFDDGTGEMGTLHIDIDDGTNLDLSVFSITGQQQTALTDPFAQQFIDLSAYAGQTIQVRFRVERGSGFRSDVAIDGIRFDEAPSCFAPSGLSVDSVDNSSVDLSWDNVNGATNGYILEIYNQGDDPDVDNPVATETVGSGITTGTVSGLSPNTTYEGYVISDCGSDGTSFLSSSVTFNTLCDVFDTPYNNGFENFTIGDLGTDVDCWSEQSQTGFVWEASDDDTTSNNTGPNQAFEGSNFVYTEATTGNLGDEAILLSPLIDLSNLSSPVINFYLHMHGGDMGTLHIDVDDGTGFIDDVFTISGEQQPNQGDAWLEQFVDIGAFIGDTVQIRLRGERGDGFTSDMAVDDFRVVEAPSCLKPNGVTLINEFANSAEFSWDPITNATSGYIWEVYTAGDDPATGTPVSTGSVPAGTTQATADGLTPETDYDFYVISDCGSNDGLSELSLPVAFTTTELCPVPSNFEANNVQSTSVDLNWTAIPNDNGGYNWSVFNQGDDPITGTPVESGNVPSGSSSVNVTGLTQNTAYEAYIEVDCGAADGMSDLSAPLPFTTTCTAITAPVTENFDGSTWVAGTGFGNDNDAIDDCWERNPVNNGTDYAWQTRSGDTGSGATGPNDDFNGGANYIYTEASDGSQGDEALLESPLIDASGLNVPQLRFYYHMYGDDMGTLHVDVDDGTGYSLDEFTISGQQQTSGDEDWVLVTVNLPNFNVSNLRVRFRGERGTGFNSDMAIDEFSVVEAPTCPQPNILSVSNITETTADFTWEDNTNTANDFNWFVFNAGDDPDVATPVASNTVPATTTSVTVTGLPSSSALQFYVQSDCGGGDLSLLTPPLDFQTLCDVIVAPVNEDFDDSSWVSGSGFGNDGDAINDCWDRTPVNNGTDYFWGTRSGETGSANTGPDNDFSGNGKYVYTEASDGAVGDEAFLESPLIDASGLNVPQLRFYYHMFGDDMGTLHVDVDDGTGYSLDEFSISGQQQTSGDEDWVLVVVNLPNFNVSTLKVRFRGERGDGFGSDMAVDEFSLVEAPTCPQPSDLELISVTDTTADISWTPALSSQDTFDLEVVPAGTAPTGTPTDEDVTSNPFTVTGLTSETEYDVYVRADCGGGDESFWIGPVTFQTSISPVSVDIDNSSSGNIYCYGNSDFKEWLFVKTGTSNEPLEIVFNAGLIETDPLSSDRFIVYDGFGDTAPILYDSDVDGNDLTGVNLISTSGALYITLTSDIFGSCQGGTEDLEEIDFDVFVGTLSSISFDEQNFEFYPNPVDDRLILNAKSNLENVVLFNMIGQKVKEFNSVNNSSFEIPMSDLQAGAYLMKVKIDGVSNTFRVIKK